jgi:Ser/Thr protein kinase RdoA (MazF antagonist)
VTTLPKRDGAELEGQEALFAGLTHGYGLRVQSLIGMKTVTGVLCQDGSRYIWKPASPGTTVERLRAIQHVTEQLEVRGVSLAGPLPNRWGSLLTALQTGAQGYLQPWFSGRHMNIRDRQEKLSGLAALAHLHCSLPPLDMADVPALYRPTLYDKMFLKTESLRNIWPRVQSAVPMLSDVEAELFVVVEDVLEAIQTHLHSWVGHPVQRFCHRDVAPHNVLWDGDCRVSFVDFDQAGLDDPLIDVIQWSNHAVFLNGGQDGHFHDIVKVYSDCSMLSAERRELLWRLLRFPDIFIRAASEWVRAGCPPDQRHRLIHAIHKEQNRWAVWQRDGQRQ